MLTSHRLRVYRLVGSEAGCGGWGVGGGTTKLYNRLLSRKKAIFIFYHAFSLPGPISSPQILMLSGVGPTQHISSMGIPVVKDLPVGDNLCNHVLLFNTAILRDPSLAGRAPEVSAKQGSPMDRPLGGYWGGGKLRGGLAGQPKTLGRKKFHFYAYHSV